MENKLTVFDEEMDCTEICEDIANGVTLARFCKDRKLHFGEIRTWIRSSAERERQYQIAMELRKEWAGQLICDTVLRMALFDPAEVYFDDGRLKPIKDWPPEARASLKKMKVDAVGNMEAEFIDALKAFDLVGKTLGIFAQRVEVNATETLADLVMKAVGKNDKPAENGVRKSASEDVGEKAELRQEVQDRDSTGVEGGGGTGGGSIGTDGGDAPGGGDRNTD